MILGIFCGLGAAFTQSWAYLATRHFVQRRGPRGMWDLLILGHVWMGALGLLTCVACWPWAGGGAGLFRWDVLWPLGATAVLYTLGQVGNMFAFTHDEASRVTPLFGFKVLAQAVVTSMFGASVAVGDSRMTGLQWAAVGLCVVGAVSMNFSGSRPKRRALAAVAAAVIVFSLSDYHIGWLVKGVGQTPGISGMRVAALAVGMQYLCCGAAALPLLGLVEKRGKADVKDAAMFAGTWFGSMLFLFAAFGLVGVVLGTILQSTRGIMTIVLASVMARLGHEHIESVHSRGVVLQRLGAGSLMFVAIVLYVIREVPRW